MTEARYRELLEAAPPITQKEWDALRRFVPKRSVLQESVRLALHYWRRWA